MSPAYGRAVVAADAGVDRLLTAADHAYGSGQYTVIVTADHGGHGFDHGSDDASDVTVPWIAWGRGVRAGQLADSTVRTMDVLEAPRPSSTSHLRLVLLVNVDRFRYDNLARFAEGYTGETCAPAA